MNGFYSEFVGTAKDLAISNGLDWNLVCDAEGKVTKESRWNLTALVGMMPPPTIHLGRLGVDGSSFAQLNEIAMARGQPLLQAQAMHPHWRDLYQAVVIHQLLVRKNKPLSAISAALPIRQLAPAAADTPPWEVQPDQVQLAYNAVLQSNASGKVALNFVMTVRMVFDRQHLANTPSLARFCLPFSSSESLLAQHAVDGLQKRQNTNRDTDQMRATLAERKSESKLPERRAFWEMVRIIFTENPQTLSDVIRFGVLKLLVIGGFRVGEAVLLPTDWQRWREYVDSDGSLAGEHGGISRSLMIRHFAEKQVEDVRPEGFSIYESAQHVPPMFEEVLMDTLEEVSRITGPMRERLWLQTTTGRIFPEFTKDALVPAWEMYCRVTGNALFSGSDAPVDLIAKYRETYDVSLLDAVRSHQLQQGGGFRPAAVFWTRLSHKGLRIRDREGNEFVGKISWRRAFLRVGEVESHIRKHIPTKLSDTTPATLADGTHIHPHDLLFLVPVRNVVEGRNGGVLDPTLYSAIGRISTADINDILDGTRSDSIFGRYGCSDPESFRLDSHAMRHLQTTELFRLGVADTIITKRFNRRGVAQSYEYDHRSLAEDLANIDVPPEAGTSLGENAREVYRLITANRASGPIVEEFRRIQREYGETVAFEYLNAEADGLHVTPYGLCLNSFTVDPCPKHLECFNGCIHLARTDVAEEHANLVRLRDRMAKTIEQIMRVPEPRRTAGWDNQLDHARTRLANIEIALAARPGAKAFPDGRDLSVPVEKKLGTSVLDTNKPRGRCDD